jgi:hypothetical protein
MQSIVPSAPEYSGANLVNLVAEIEHRLTGATTGTRLNPQLAAGVPDATSYIFVLFDGLGLHQLDHPEAGPLRAGLAGRLSAPFPTTTTVSLATIATGRTPRAHGVIGHMMYMPEHGVFNGLKWRGLSGEPIDHPMAELLPAPNLWERLHDAGLEPITVQPGEFMSTPLTKALYRGCRFEAAWSHEETSTATLALAAKPGRLVFVYVGEVDFAAHLYGQSSAQYAAAIRSAADTWSRLVESAPDNAAVVGTADHGHIDYSHDAKVHLASADFKGIEIYGDPRALFLRGDGAQELASGLPGTWTPLAECRSWWGAGEEHPKFAERAPAGVLLADPDRLIVPGHMDRRLIGYHGGLAPGEIDIPLLIG